MKAKTTTDTHCKNGHPWAGNTYVNPRGMNVCKRCRVENGQRWRAKKKASETVPGEGSAETEAI